MPLACRTNSSTPVAAGRLCVRLLAALCIMALGVTASPATQAPRAGSAAEIMPLSEIRPGMRGIGYTVVRGTEPEPFDLEVLGVLENTFPNQSLILARLAGLGLERAGIAAGMSGSPVYIDDRLVGAVAYRIGSFPTEPVAGITPIENMLRIGDVEQTRLAHEAPRDAAPSLVAAAIGLIGGRPVDLAPLQPAARALGIAPISTPVSIGGVDAEVVRRIGPLFETMGWQPTLGGTSQSNELGGPLRPGSAVAAQLMRGDLTFTATGTVTWVDGDRVLAFGHPFLQAGSVDFPMTTAEVLMVLPSLADSQKITAAGEQMIGAIRQDRQAGVLGVVGAAPLMVPVALHVDVGGIEERFDFEMVAHKTLSPTFLFIGLGNALQSISALSGDNALSVTGALTLAGDYEAVRIENRFSSSVQAFFALAQTIAGIYQQLYENPFQPLSVSGIELDISVRDDLRVADITRVWADRAEVRAGDELTLSVWLKPYRQPEVQIDIPVRIPRDAAPGAVSILVGDAATMTAAESSAARGEVQPQSVEQLIGRLNRSRPSDHVYYQLSRDAAGAFYSGRRMPSLPPSVLGVLAGGQTSGESTLLSKKVLLEASEAVEYVVSGEHRLTINVRR